jgi:endonuclease/exonuclease/phosphatase family metal-dependent hydrolase
MRLRVVSFNARSFRAGIDQAAAAMGDDLPDVVLVQECGSRFAVRRFARALGLEAVSSHRWFRPVRNAVLFHGAWRLVGVDVETLSREGRTRPRGFMAARLRRGDVRVAAISAHLGLAPRERERHARELTDWLRSCPEHLVVGADLNEGPEGGAARWISERLFDAFVAAGKGGAATFPAAAPTARIDYVFVSEGLHVLAAWVAAPPAGGPASDHRPVMADVEVAEG